MPFEPPLFEAQVIDKPATAGGSPEQACLFWIGVCPEPVRRPLQHTSSYSAHGLFATGAYPLPEGSGLRR